MPRALCLLLLHAAAAVLAGATGSPAAFPRILFEENRGQADSSVRFLARARGQQVLLTRNDVVLVPAGSPPVRLSFAGSTSPRWEAAGSATESISYYLGNDPARWIEGARQFERVAWRAVYPGIDAIFYGAGNDLEYDLLIAPGADPGQVRLRFSGGHVTLRGDGSIEVGGADRFIRQKSPRIYQQGADGRRKEIAGRFVRTGHNEFGLKLGSYETSRPLVVDPVLEASTYLGGENDDEVTVVGEGFVAGTTRSVLFPDAIAERRRTRDIFVRGLGIFGPLGITRDAFSNTVVIGGSGDDELTGAARIPIGINTLYLVGATNSEDLPGARSRTPPSTYRGGKSDGFVLSFSTGGLVLNFGSGLYIGGSGEDRINAIATTTGSSIAIVGVTDSPDLPVRNAIQTSLAGQKDAFFGVAFGELSSTTLSLSYLGGEGDDSADAVALLFGNRALIGGETRSANFPFRAPESAVLAGPSDAFLAQVDVTFTTAQAPPTIPSITAQLFGGSGEDRILALTTTANTTFNTVDDQLLRQTSPIVGIAGTTTSADLPIRNAAQEKPGGARDIFVGIWTAATNSFEWLTYLGGSGDDIVTSIAQSWSGDLLLGGWTRSTDLPLVEALQPQPGAGEDGLVALFERSGKPRHVTYWGGSGDDRVNGVNFSPGRLARIGGATTSADLPQRQPWQPLRGANLDGFVAEIGTAYLSGPDEIILPKDGTVPISLRTNQTSARLPVTYRSSDPTRVRFWRLGRSSVDLTVALEENLLIEALAGDSEVDITASVSGHPLKTIRVKLFPAALEPVVTRRISTWGPPIIPRAVLRAIDPATNRPVGPAPNFFRNEFTPPAMRWTSSDDNVIQPSLDPQAGTAVLLPRNTGEARITLDASGFPIYEPEPVIVTVERPILDVRDLRLGQDLQTSLPITLLNPVGNATSGLRGTLTARSSDPTRLVLSAQPTDPGRGEVTIRMDDRARPTIWAQALADAGDVQVILTSPEFEERSLTVSLERTVVQWGIPTGTFAQFEESPSLLVRAQRELSVLIRGESGAFGASLRPGAPSLLLRLANSSSTVLELNRPTTVFGSTERFTVIGLSEGNATLSMTINPPRYLFANQSLAIRVTPALSAPVLFAPDQVLLGKDLQQLVTVRINGSSDAEVTVVSDDPSGVLLGLDSRSTGTSQLILRPRPGASEFSFLLQGLRGSGDVRVRVRIPQAPEREIRVTLLPSGFGANIFSTFSRGFDAQLSITPYALDEVTGAGLRPQLLRPGIQAEVRLRTEGAPIQLSPSLVVLREASASADFTYPAPGQETVVILEAPPGFTSSPTLSRITLRAPTPFLSASDLGTARDGLTRFSFQAGFQAPVEVTATSADPAKLLLSTAPDQAGTASVRWTANGNTDLYLHGLTDVGSTQLRIEQRDRNPVDLTVPFFPVSMQLQPDTFGLEGVALLPTQPARWTATLLHRGSRTVTLRPGASPVAFSLRSSNPSVARMTPETVEFSSARNSFPIQAVPVSEGVSELVVEAGTSTSITPIRSRIPIIVRTPQVTGSAMTLGKNLQSLVQFSLERNSFLNPDGLIVTLTSSDPGRLLLSRSAVTPGSASITVAATPGDRLTQPVYLQALDGEGEVTVRATADGFRESSVTVRLTPSWFSMFRSSATSLSAGSSLDLSISPTYQVPFGEPLTRSVTLRPGLGDSRVRVVSDNPSVALATPETLVFTPADSSKTTTIRAVFAGVANLSIEQPQGFGPAPAEAASLSLRVVPRALTSCGEISVGRDSQVTCSVSAPAGTLITAVSSDATRLVVSADQRTIGSERVSVTVGSAGQAVFILQGLASDGTVEVVVSAPGFDAGRTAIVLRPSEISWDLSPNPGTFSLRVGATGSFRLGLYNRGPFGLVEAAVRAGASIPIDVVSTPSGIVSADPGRVTLSGTERSKFVSLRGTALGSTIVRVSPPPGFTANPTPLLINVVP